MTRREIRDKIFKIVFTAEFNGKGEMDEQLELAFDSELPGDEEDDPLLYAAVSDADRAYISVKVHGIMDRLDDIDRTISEISEGWKLSRIGKEELAILRLGVYEVVYDEDIPDKVAINEAVELAKRYCDAPASKFVNALLAKLVKEPSEKKKDAPVQTAADDVNTADGPSGVDNGAE